MRHQLPSVHKARRTSSGLYHQRNTEEVIAEWKADNNSLTVAIRVPTMCTVWPQTQPSCVMLIQSTGTTRDRENTQGAAAHTGKMELEVKSVKQEQGTTKSRK